MNPKNNNRTRIILNPNILIHDRPDMRGLEHETVDEYLTRGGKIIKIEPGISAEPIFRRAREGFKVSKSKEEVNPWP